MGMNQERLPLLFHEAQPIVIDQVGDIDAGDGIRVSLLPTHLLIEVEAGNGHGFMKVSVATLLDALCLQSGGFA